ncbi:MAG: hypothetical protein BM556_01885 [Bacteriovorax sp. MedPE-SWde]|nr:MAG: hypothetical protein BM556_01885 [Bacteriovorax sp. MedPE-SWde]
MKKALRNISILIVILLVGYFIYDYLEGDYIPESKRKFYKKVKYKRRELKFTRRELMHEELPEYEKEADPEKVIIKGNGNGLAEIKEALKALDKRHKECEAFLAKALPNEEIIDPENEIFRSPERVTAKVVDVFTEILTREVSSSALLTFENFYKDKSDVEADLFFNTLRSSLICRGADTGLFLESAYEAMKDNWSEKEVEEFNSALLGMLSNSLESDVLPDNLLFSLNILRLVGTSSKQTEEYYSELDDVYGRISSYEDNFFDEIQDSKKIYSPAEKFEGYFEELDQISEDIRYIMNRRFKSFAQEDN